MSEETIASDDGVEGPSRRRLRFTRARRNVQSGNAIAVVGAIVLVFGLAQLFAGALSAGVTTDEPTHTDRTISWIDNGWYVPAAFQLEGRPDPANPISTPYVYGPAFSAIAHAANVVARNESLKTVSRASDAYAVRHLVVAGLAAIAVAAVGLGVFLLTRSPLFGLWAAAGLLALPRWTGQSFFNIKDVPAATGYTLVTVGLLLALSVTRGQPASRRRQLAIIAMLAGGIYIGAGTRLSLWLPFLISLLAYAALRIGQRTLGGLGRASGSDFAVGIGAALGVVAIAVLYPNVTTTPLTLLAESVATSADYPYVGFTLTAGQLLPATPPWWYLPVWFGAAQPLLLSALAIFGALAGLKLALATGGFLSKERFWRLPELGLLLVFLQVLLIPTGTLVDGAVTYSGLRQHLYVLPMIAVLAGYGAARVWRWSGSRNAANTWKLIATMGVSVALIVPMVEQTILFPYNYTYVNPVASIGGVNDRWETDYWFASAPEAIARVPRGADLRCSSFLIPAWSPKAEPELGPCNSDQFEPFANRRGDSATTELEPDDDSVWVIARKRGGNQPPDYCESVDDVTRWLRGERVTLAHVLRCDRNQVP